MTSIEQAREAVRWCRRLAECSETPGAITRAFLSPPMRDVHDLLAGWMSRAGMSVAVDAVGNIRGVYPATASTQETRRLFIGSHLDTVPNAGVFDGVLGVVLGVALVEMLAGERLPFGIEVVGFSDEEGVRFGMPFIGSRAFAGSFDRALLERRDAHGRNLEEAIRDYGLDPARISDAEFADRPLGYLEFHIEQGPVLDDLERPLAVVDAIVGQSRAEVVFTGMAGHAGTTPMKARRDAFACAAEWIGEVERHARKTAGLVATVGRVEVEPNAVNVVPGACRASLDVRHADDDVRRNAIEKMERAAKDVARRRGLDASWEIRLDQATVPMAGGLSSALGRAVELAGFPLHRMSSGAGHDAMVVASRMPAAMLFVRCARGISHHPSESVREEDVAAALDAGLAFLRGMAGDR